MRTDFCKKTEISFNERGHLEFMMTHYDERFRVTGDNLYEFAFKLTLKAWEKLDGGDGVISTDCEKACSLPVGACASAVQLSLDRILLKMLDDGKPRGIDGLIFASGSDAGKVAVELTKLELCGKVRKLAGARYVRR